MTRSGDGDLDAARVGTEANPSAGPCAADPSIGAPGPDALTQALELAREAAARITAQFGTALDRAARVKVSRAFERVLVPPYVPLSHPFVERLVGTLRRECLDRTLFWTAADLEAKLQEFQRYFNEYRTHAGLEGQLPDSGGAPSPISFASYGWQKHCPGLYQTPIAA